MIATSSLHITDDLCVIAHRGLDCVKHVKTMAPSLVLLLVLASCGGETVGSGLGSPTGTGSGSGNQIGSGTGSTSGSGTSSGTGSMDSDGGGPGSDGGDQCATPPTTHTYVICDGEWRSGHSTLPLCAPDVSHGAVCPQGTPGCYSCTPENNTLVAFTCTFEGSGNGSWWEPGNTGGHAMDPCSP